MTKDLGRNRREAALQLHGPRSLEVHDVRDVSDVKTLWNTRSGVQALYDGGWAERLDLGEDTQDAHDVVGRIADSPDTVHRQHIEFGARRGLQGRMTRSVVRADAGMEGGCS